ncbi:SWR1 complex subunit 2 [Linum perenne]
MEASKEDDAPVVFLDRTARATRGKRMTKLLDDEVEEDETFWNQDALKEDENDDNYQEEAEAPDEFDSDFDDDEPEPDNEAENEAMERRPPRKRLIFPGKTLPKKKKKKDLSKLDNEPSSKDEKPNEQTTTTPEHHDVPDEVEEERVVRKSTRTSVIVRQAERDAIRAALQATMKPIKRKKEGEEKKMSQEEMLLEAAQTEIMNLRNLERVLAREEEVKKRAAVSKAVYSGPQIRFSSKDGRTYLEFKGLSFHSQLSTTPIPYPEKACCVVTGLPAKYRDPKTGKPYATIEAFKIIRQRFEEENSKNLNKEMDMGALFNALKGKGFVNRRKRSPFFAIKKTTTHFSYFPPPCRIPMFDIDDSD